MSYQRSDLLWNDGQCIHAAEGDRMVDQDKRTFLVWTLCEKDVPANRSHKGDHSDTTCDECLAGNSSRIASRLREGPGVSSCDAPVSAECTTRIHWRCSTRG
jgi:hypothetical protein